MTVVTSRSIRRCALVVVGALLLSIAAGCGSSPGKPSPAATLPASGAVAAPFQATQDGLAANGLCARGNQPRFLKQLVMAKSASAEMTAIDATDVFTSTQDKFHAVVSFDNAPAETVLRLQWYVIEAQGDTQNLKLDTSQSVVNGSGSVDFTLTSASGPWPVGSYCVELDVNGKPAMARVFSVKADENAAAASITDVKFAAVVNSPSYEPVDPTREFDRTEQVIHSVVEIKDAPGGTHFTARWHMPDESTQEFTITSQGTRRIDFVLVAPAGGEFVSGKYKVDLLINEKVERTEEFTVK